MVTSLWRSSTGASFPPPARVLVAPQLTVVEPIQAKNGTFVVIDLRNWPNLGGATGEPAAPRLIAELPARENAQLNLGDYALNKPRLNN